MSNHVVHADTSSTGLRAHLPGILRALLGTAVAVAGVIIVIGELEYLLRRCNSEAVVMEVRFWPPFAAEALIVAGLVLAGWPRAKAGTADRRSSRRCRVRQATLSVIAIVLGAVLVVLAYEFAIGPCARPATTLPTIWVGGHVAGPVALATGILAAVRPTTSDQYAGQPVPLS